MSSRSKGRYTDVNSALAPRGLLPEGKRANGNVEVVHARVPRPGETNGHDIVYGKFVRAAVNVAGNTLEREHAYGRISERAYRAGRLFEELFLAIATGQSAMAVLDRVGGGAAQNDLASTRIAKLMDRAACAVEAEKDARSICGRDGYLLLRAVLIDGQTFTQVAKAQGFPKGRGPRRVAGQWREAIEALGKGWL